MKRNRRKKESVILSVVLGIYCLNRFYLKTIGVSGFVGYVLRCHFNDFLGGICILAYFSLVFSYSRYDKIDFTRPFNALVITFCCGVFWEFIFPHIFHHGTSDTLDLLAYSFGGLFYSTIHISLKKGNRGA